MKIRATCLPTGVPVLYETCPLLDPVPGQGFISDLLLLAVELIGNKTQLEMVPDQDYESDSLTSTKEDFVQNLAKRNVDILTYGQGMIFDSNSRSDFFFHMDSLPPVALRDVVIVNAPRRIPDLSLMETFSPPTWVVGLITYFIMIVTVHFLWNRSQSNPLHLAFAISFTQRNQKKWKSLGRVAFFLITLWALCSKQGQINVKGRIVKLMAPNRHPKPPFRTLEEAGDLAETGEYIYVERDEQPLCSGWFDLSPPEKKFCQKVAGITMTLPTAEVPHYVSKNVNTFFCQNFQEATINKERFPNLGIISVPEFPVDHYPLIGFPLAKNATANQTRRRLELKALFTKLFSRIHESGVLEKLKRDSRLLFDFSENMKLRNQSSKLLWSPVRLPGVKIPFRTLGIGLLLAVFILIFERFHFKHFSKA